MCLHFLDLPNELLCRIFAYVDFRDLYHCTLTCIFLQQVIMASVELQFSMALGVNRVVCLEHLSSGQSLPSRLQLLRRRQQEWRYLKWNKRFTIECPQVSSMLYEYLGGVYSRGNSHLISFVSLPPSGDHTNAASWCHSMNSAIIDYTTMSSQDLILIVTASPAGSDFVFTTHINTMSMNDPHPRATVLTHGSLAKTLVEDDFQLYWGAVTIQVAGDYVALLVRHVRGRAMSYIDIWNWTQDNSSHQCEIMAKNDISDICFLSGGTLLVTRLLDNCIEIFNFDGNVITSKVRFGLPALPPNCNGYMLMRARSYPISDDIAISRNPLPSLERSLFYPSPEDRICCISCQMPADTYIRKLFVHIRVFLGMDPRVSRFLTETPSSSVPWEIWGPQNTRWCLGSFVDRSYTLYGLKAIDIVLPVANEIEGLGYRLRVWDFNPYAPSNPEDDTLLEDWQKGSVVTECLRIPKGALFAEDVESHLPYREVITKEHFKLSDAMIDGAQIVLKKNNDDGGDTLTVLRF